MVRRVNDLMFIKGDHRSVGYGKQYTLVWSCVEDREW